MPSLLQTIPGLLLSTASLVRAQSFTSSASGYAGYSLGLAGDQDSAVYETDTTDTALTSATVPEPDVYLNASVSVGEIQIIVANLSAKVNLDAQVLSLLSFNAGVDVSIAKVNLTIENITAKVLLEARLGNLVTMIDDVLDSIDLNPLIASLGTDASTLASGLGSVLNDTSSTLSSTVSNLTSSTLQTRDYDLDNNVLYSANDYSGNTHTNRILAPTNGNIVDQYLDNDGHVLSQKVVGSYKADMTALGAAQAVVYRGQNVQVREYVYTPFLGLSVVSAVYTDAAGAVVAARVLSETSAGGSSTIGNNS